MPRPYIMWKKQSSVTYSTDQEKQGLQDVYYISELK